MNTTRRNLLKFVGGGAAGLVLLVALVIYFMGGFRTKT